jgi:hypothetical protein
MEEGGPLMAYEYIDEPGRFEYVDDTEPVTGMDRFVKGVRDPIDGGAQLLTNVLPDGVVKAGNDLNNWIADKTGMVARLPSGGLKQAQGEANQKYEAGRVAAANGGDPGFDWMRLAGNVVNPVSLITGAMAPAVASLGGRMAVGAGIGAVNSAMAPVNGDDYWKQKGMQMALGTALGGAAPAVAGGAARMVSPNATRNANLQLLKSEGVTPTVGQTLGGRWNAFEEKLQSLPLFGDGIAVARGRTMEEFNTAAINRAAGKVGAKVEGAGHIAVREAGDAISQAYDDALNQIKFVKFDKTFATDLKQLKGMAQQLTPPMRAKFNAKLDQVLQGRMSGGGSMLGPTYKKVDSEIGRLASTYGKSATASEAELGDAFAQLRDLLKQQAFRTNPKAAQALAKADEGWANLVRIEAAGKSAKNAEGVFTPGQLNAAVSSADQSTRGRAVARGNALMQDLSNAGQKVLGNKVSDSGTPGRLMYGLGTLGVGGYVNPLIPAALGGGALMYTRPMQQLLTRAVTSRPQFAEPVANTLRQASPGFGLLGAPVGAGLLNAHAQ